jgi:hypothetical protein
MAARMYFWSARIRKLLDLDNRNRKRRLRARSADNNRKLALGLWRSRCWFTLEDMMVKCRLSVDDLRPLHSIARAGSLLWPTAFLRSFVSTLMEPGLRNGEGYLAFEKGWLAHANNDTAFY